MTASIAMSLGAARRAARSTGPVIGTLACRPAADEDETRADEKKAAWVARGEVEENTDAWLQTMRGGRPVPGLEDGAPGGRCAFVCRASK